MCWWLVAWFGGEGSWCFEAGGVRGLFCVRGVVGGGGCDFGWRVLAAAVVGGFW